MSASNEEIITFLLGDIIEIDAQDNELLNKQKFVINYIDNSLMKLTNIETYNDIELKIKSSGELSDESIEGISLISRSSKKGYARQNDLLPGTWISIYFNTNVPEVVTGNITNLEEDMIEIRTYPDDETIYIDFG